MTRHLADLAEAPEHAVYQPQQDSQLLCEMMENTGLVPGRRVADLCTGSGVVAIRAARLGAASVTAFDVSDEAVSAARANVRAAGVDVDVRLGTFTASRQFGPFDVVACNPPYVPIPPDDDLATIPGAGPAQAYNAGSDGRLVLDPLCAAAPSLLAEEGTLLVVQSEFADADASLVALRAVGLKASVIARYWIPFGPVTTARAGWLERTGWLAPGRRVEELVVIRADVVP